MSLSSLSVVIDCTALFFMYQCTSDWVCRSCNQQGHRMVDCPHDLGFPDPNISVHDGVEDSLEVGVGVVY
jgi:hypothetical protein